MKSVDFKISRIKNQILLNIILGDKGYVRDKVRQSIREEFMWIMDTIRDAVKNEIAQ